MIKFRGKAQDGEWLYGDLLHDCHDIENWYHEVGIGDPGCHPDGVIPETVGQLVFVLADGTEIYEGDIVSLEYGMFDECVVGPHGEIEVHGREYTTTLLKWIPTDDCVLKGNIHDRGDSD